MLPIPLFSLDDFILLIVRIFAYVGFGLYVVFAIVVLRQVQTMRKTVETTLSPLMLLLAFAHLALAVWALFFAVTYLK